MSNKLRFDDKVVVVTGAGNGLGRSHALAFAARGAKVLVNDLGGDPHGAGKGNAAADRVVAEIREAGGTAEPNYDSVTDGDKIVQAALDHFGRIDVLVNNAGILRDVSFHKMTEDDWDAVYNVHVKGAFAVTHAAWPHMREQQFGRVLFTASAAGLYGNFGQANYSMAKLGLLGLAKTLAVEGKKRNIGVNTIAPVAGSRLTETILPPEIVEQLKPEFVSPLVVYLCHQDTDVTGGIYEVGAGWISSLRWERTKGHAFKLGRGFQAEDVRTQWSQINDFSEATNPNEVNAALSPIMANLKSLDSKGGNEFIDVDEALGYEFPEVHNSYDEKQVALYALGIGAAHDALDENELRYVYENHGKGFVPFPTYGVVPALNAMFENPTAPGMNYGFDRILHGEHYLELKRPLPRSAKLTHKAKISEIWDKGKNALVVTETRSFDESGDELFVNRLTTVVRGAGGWGGERGDTQKPVTIPDRGPDATVTDTISDNQALLYRLSGDINPLHADPSMAKAVGFERPILHGLCTFGYAARHIINSFADGDARKFKSIAVRFADVVFPGETLVTEMWKENDNRIVFQCKVKERDAVVIKNAALELFEQIPEKTAKSKPQAQAAAAATPANDSESAQVFSAIGQYVSNHPELVDSVSAVFQFKLSEPDSAWIIDLKNAPGAVREGTTEADTTLELTDADFLAMASGAEDAQAMYFAQRLRIAGNLMLAQKLNFLKKVKEEVGAAPAAASGDAAAAAATGAGAVFAKIGDYVGANPSLVGEVGKVFQFRFTDPESQWFIDLKDGSGQVGEGTHDAPDVTLSMNETDWVGLATGTENAQALYLGGRLKIEGDLTAAMKLDFLKRVADGGSSPKKSRAPEIFEQLSGKLGSGVYQFFLSDPDSEWIVDGEPRNGRADNADVTVRVSEADLAALASGEAQAQDLFQRGRLEVHGNIELVKSL